MTKKSTTWLAIAIVLVLLAGAGAFAFFTLPLKAETAAEDATADLDSGTIESSVWSDEKTAKKLHDLVLGTVAQSMKKRSVELTGTEKHGDDVVAQLKWTWTNSDGEPWEYTSELPLRKKGLLWSAELTPTVLHPDLDDGRVLVSQKKPGARGAILGEDDEELMAEGPVVDIGIHPAKLEAADGNGKGGQDTLTTLQDELDIDLKALKERIDKAEPEQFVPVITLRESDYRRVKDTIHSLPGTVFNSHTQPLSRKKGFAGPTLGTAGAASAEEVEASDGELTGESVVGKSGLQKAFDEELSGPGSEAIYIADADEEKGSDEDASDGDEGKAAEPVLVHEFPGHDGEDITTTLNVGVQEAADKAAATGKKPTALVAIRPSDGHIIAVANQDPEGAAWDRALTGQYAPGSVFKVASGLALLESGVAAKTTLDCPKTTTVDGKSFKNAEDHVLGEVAFEDDFAESCNTAFVDAAEKVSASDVANAASSLGMDDIDLGIEAKMATVPSEDDAVTHAAQMIGQGKVNSSPLAVAVMAASVAAGDTVDPLLVVSGESEDGRGSETESGQAIDADAATTMQKLMRRAVTDGTADALQDVPGEPVHGKTGTAEYGGETPPRTHSWFAGYQGDVAVAVLVEDGGFGAEAAVPVAKKFFTELN
ncbi:penicillin-binding transpeptidase domain-containing protein [Brevibacterium sp. RIT 803]|uniref:penicillin-binding transpeptidase domain-containing protein n=1 Tax=Brevibacterium sp. RIT 803 TaxID=2810210 RepID=UPI00194F3932|nr:penicillin-binding transpeptidase domain-containing protein [Brevibacterium sp. RIT 803]MBM6589801.1 cell division protein FtsI [Brevibacterium sp. RIT 803]